MNIFRSKRLKLSAYIVLGCLMVFTILVLSTLGVNAQSGTPFTTIEEVIRNEKIEIKGYQFPTNQTFNVRMGAYGSYGINGAVSSTQVNSGNGNFTAEINIPPGVANYDVIAIRLDNAGPYYAYNWFYNNSTTGVVASSDINRNTTGNNDRSAVAAYTGTPGLEFVKIEGEDVTVKTINFPPNQTFFVTMGSRDANGFGNNVGTIQSGDGADKEYTFTIPSRISHYGYIRLRAQTGHSRPYSAYVSFFNPAPVAVAGDVDRPVQGNVEPQADTRVLWLGNPSMKICAVEAGKSVTIETYNLPTNLTYTVRMNNYGTQGINGYQATATVQPGNNATVKQTIDIPPQIAGNGVIAIRVEAGIYHAYNWFYNNNASGYC